MNLILRNSKSVEWYTDLSPIFSNILELKDYEYLISDLEINGKLIEPFRVDEDELFISGNQLFDLVTENKIQFCWGVFSAFEMMPDIIEPEIPYADCNPDFWNGSPTPQAKGASFEIVCFDSSCTLFIGINKIIRNKLIVIYSDIKDLDIENKKYPCHPKLT